MLNEAEGRAREIEHMLEYFDADDLPSPAPHFQPVRGLDRDEIAVGVSPDSGLKYTSYRTLTALSRGQEPGPEGSIGKMESANLNKAVYEEVMALLGADVVLMERFDPVDYLRLIEEYQVTHTQLVPTMFSRMLKLPAEERLTATRELMHKDIHRH